MLWLRDLIDDMRLGLRALGGNPGFAAVVVLTLALGIGANSAIFSIVHAVLLRPLPFPDPERLLLVTEFNPDKNVVHTGVPLPDYRLWSQQIHVFAETGAYWNVSASDGIVFSGSGSPERIRATIVTNSFFALLGARPVLGRGFTPEEEQPGGAHVFLASDGLWRRNLGANPGAIGKTFDLDGESFTLIGVLPAGFQFPQRCEVWMPLSALTARQFNDRVSHPFSVLARLRLGSHAEQARGELESLQKQLAQSYPETNANWHARVRPLLDDFVGNARLSVLVLYGAVVFVFLIACANAANLWLARGIARDREFAVRAALGAGRSRLLRQTLAESLTVVLISAAAGLLLARWGLDLIFAASSGSIPRLDQFRLNGPMLLFAAVTIFATTLLVGFVPALQASAIKSQNALRDGGRTGSSGMRSRTRAALVVSEVALTLMLLCGAGLLLKSFVAVSRVHPGFDANNLMTMKVALPDAQYPRLEQRVDFLAQLLAGVRSLPGVTAAAAASSLPMSGVTNWGSFHVVGQPLSDWAHAPSLEFRNVSAGYFRTMGIPVLQGREFTGAEIFSDAPVVIVNQAMAARFFAGVNPLGRRIEAGSSQRPREVIGVVGDVRDFGLDTEGQPEIFVPCRWWNSVSLVVRSASATAALVPAVRTRLAALDKNVPLYQAAEMDELLDNSTAFRRFSLTLLALFAALALLLAAIGVYVLLSFSVSRRTRELGIRIALGAQPRDALWLIVRQGMRLVLAGAVLGAIASLALARLISGLLYGVSPADPLAYLAATLVLLSVAAVACYVPARRTLRLDPIRALRHE